MKNKSLLFLIFFTSLGAYAGDFERFICSGSGSQTIVGKINPKAIAYLELEVEGIDNIFDLENNYWLEWYSLSEQSVVFGNLRNAEWEDFTSQYYNNRYKIRFGVRDKFSKILYDKRNFSAIIYSKDRKVTKLSCIFSSF